LSGASRDSRLPASQDRVHREPRLTQTPEKPTGLGYDPRMKLEVALSAAVLVACSHDVSRQYRRAPCSFDASSMCEAGGESNLEMTGPGCNALDEFGSPQFCPTTFTSPGFGAGCCLIQASTTNQIIWYFFDCV